MTDMLERSISKLSELPSPLQWSDVERRADERQELVADAPERSRVTRVAAGLLAAAILLAVVVVVWQRDPVGQDLQTDVGGPASSPVESTIPLDVTPSTTAPGTGSSALRTRRFPVTAVTDDAYLVWGGETGSDEQDHLDGFAVDLESGAVTTIPAAPISMAWTSQGAWTGTELIVWTSTSGCDTCLPITPEAAAWSPSTATWRAVTPPPPEAIAAADSSVWAGDRIVTVTSKGVAASYDPATDVWTMLPSLDVTVWGRGSLIWTGTEVVFWATAGFAGPFPAPVGDPVADRGWRWTPGADSWAPLPDLPLGFRTTRASAVWTGDDLVVWGAATGGAGSSDVGVGARWRPDSDLWQAMAPSPQPAGAGNDGTHGSQALGADPGTGDVVVRPLLLNGFGEDPVQVLVYSPASNSWRSLGVLIAGWDPTVGVVGGKVFVPDPEAPIAGEIG